MGYRQVSIADLHNKINNYQESGPAGTYPVLPDENTQVLFVIAIGGTSLILTDIETSVAHKFSVGESFVHPFRFNKGFILAGTDATVRFVRA